MGPSWLACAWRVAARTHHALAASPAACRLAPPCPVLAVQDQKSALLRLAGSSEEAGFAERFQLYLLARQQEAGPEGERRHMRAPRPDEEQYQRLCRRILAALALSSLLQEVISSLEWFPGDGVPSATIRRYVEAVRSCHALPLRTAAHCPLPAVAQDATEAGVRAEFGYGEHGRAFAELRVRQQVERAGGTCMLPHPICADRWLSVLLGDVCKQQSLLPSLTEGALGRVCWQGGGLCSNDRPDTGCRRLDVPCGRQGSRCIHIMICSAVAV